MSLARREKSIAREQLREQQICPECHYDLKANVSGVCPECGTEVVEH